jgi:hypothetical protein
MTYGRIVTDLRRVASFLSIRWLTLLEIEKRESIGLSEMDRKGMGDLAQL